MSEQTISFADLSDRGTAFADGTVNFSTETLQTASQTQYHRLLALIGDGDKVGEPGEIGHVLSRFGADAAVNSLATDNTAADPVLIRAHGRTGNSTAGNLTSAVTFTNAGGFGLRNSADNTNKGALLNAGDAIDFAVQPVGGQARVLSSIAFSIDMQGQSGTVRSRSIPTARC